jgi:4-diphosphocytidyl-2-C-methyl-D-erythritol kinase
MANFFINCGGFAFIPTKRRVSTGRISTFSAPNIRVSGAISSPIAGQLKSVSSTVDSEGCSKVSLLSPCKINLFLRIERRRPDGYHDLASLFQAIGLGDTLTIELLPSEDADDIFTCNMEGIPTDQSNLVLRAVNLMRKQTGYTQKVRWGVDLKF